MIYFSMFCLGYFLPPSHIECWRKFVVAGRYLVKFFYIEQKCKEFFVFLSLFPFTTSVSSAFREREMLAEVQYFLLHTIALPGDSVLITDLLTCLLWPMIHRKQNHFGKPVVIVYLNQKQ